MIIEPPDKGQSGVAEAKSGRLLTRAGRLRKALHLSRSRQVGSGLGLAGVLTLSLWLSGIIDTVATLTAYATAVLAAGTTGLAFGTIGLYIEQRRQSQREPTQETRFFDQAKHMVEQTVPEMPDDRITAFAEFRDPDGTWWRADQDGNIGPPPPTKLYEAPERPTFGRGLG